MPLLQIVSKIYGKRTFYYFKLTLPRIEGLISQEKATIIVSVVCLRLHYSNVSGRCSDNLLEGRQVNFRGRPVETAGIQCLRKMLPVSASYFTCKTLYLRPPQAFLPA